MAPHEKVYVDDEWLDDSNHSGIGCSECHGGDPKANDFEAAHQAVVRDPSFPPKGVCAECHDQADHYATSLHATLSPMRLTIQRRGDPDPDVQQKLNQAFDRHCASCHSSCGQCHISRPTSVEGGLLAGHVFKKKAPVKLTCTACHGSRLGDEYYGKVKDAKPDIHQQKAFMNCQRCHADKEMHGDGGVYEHRQDVKAGPGCVDCHRKIYEDTGQNRETHQQHREKVACSVCHAQPYTNCYGCHLKVDEQGEKYYELAKHNVDLKIGLNPAPTPDRPERFVILRHVPIAPTTFDYYAPGALTNFDRFPTWKPATPHNIRRQTSQNSACENCHGKPGLFLQEKDIDPEYRQANRSVVVPEQMLPTAFDPNKPILTQSETEKKGEEK